MNSRAKSLRRPTIRRGWHPRAAAPARGLQAVCARELGVAVDKRQQTSDWSQRPLGVEQVEYAALDAEMLFRVWERLQPSTIKASQ